MTVSALLPLDEIRRARERIAPHVLVTPTLPSTELASSVGCRVSVKLEMLQHAGSFKARGTMNQLLDLGEQAERGVVGVSGGNFARALAWAAAQLGVTATVVMPRGAPASSIAATEALGAIVVLTDDISAAFAEHQRRVDAGAAPTHPFENDAMMTGNGTLGLELLDQVPDLTDVVVAVGGGGLLGGVLSAVHGVRPDVRVWAVEVVGADSLARSMAAGEPVPIRPSSAIATLSSPFTARRTLELADRLADVMVVSDAEAVAASIELLDDHNIKTEPAAATTLVAARRLRDRLEPDAHVGLILCGANITAAELLAMA